jgi:hypothetical protein
MEKEVYYLFFVENVTNKNGIAGYMPLQYQSGFIYDNTQAVNIAHELAHGVFNLTHTFSAPFIAPEGQSDNLLDYNQNTALWKHQWKLVHDPQNRWFKFLQDEEEGEGIFKPDLSGVFYTDSLLFNNQTLYFVPQLEEKMTLSAKNKEDNNYKIQWNINEKSFNSDTASFVVNTEFFGDRERIRIEARDKVIFGKDSIVTVFFEKIEINSIAIIDSLMLFLKDTKQKFDSLQSILPEHIEENMDALTLLETKYISIGMNSEFETPPAVHETTYSQILSQMYYLDKLIASIDNLDKYVDKIIEIMEDTEKKSTFTQSVLMDMKTINPFVQKEVLEEQYMEMIIQGFYEQLNKLIEK